MDDSELRDTDDAAATTQPFAQETNSLYYSGYVPQANGLLCYSYMIPMMQQQPLST